MSSKACLSFDVNCTLSPSVLELDTHMVVYMELTRVHVLITGDVVISGKCTCDAVRDSETIFMEAAYVLLLKALTCQTKTLFNLYTV